MEIELEKKLKQHKIETDEWFANLKKQKTMEMIEWFRWKLRKKKEETPGTVIDTGHTMHKGFQEYLQTVHNGSRYAS